jgi:GNAT superfamily N-acetyltransferase
MWTNIFNDPIETVYVAELSGQLIGFINYGPCFNKKHDESIKELRALYLCPEYFSKGIGSGLMEIVLQELNNSDCKRLTLWVLSSNKQALNFYHKMGFKLTGETQKEELHSQILVDLEMVLLLS